MSRVFRSVEDLTAAVGAQLGPTDWVAVEQSRVDAFADATGDHQWIHVDVERATAGPFGGTIAHGYLTLSLCSLFLPQLMRVEMSGMGINYGLNKVRFTSPVPSGSRLRGRMKLLSCEPIEAGWASFTVLSVLPRLRVKVEGMDRGSLRSRCEWPKMSTPEAGLRPTP